MNKRRCRIISAFLTAALAASLTACNTDQHEKVYWEDTLPTAASTKASASVSVVTEGTKPPISIEVPEVTTTVPTTPDTELATTTTTVTAATTPNVTEKTQASSEDSVTVSTVSGVPTVMMSDFSTSESSDYPALPKPESTTAASSENSTHVTELSDGTITELEHSELTGTGNSVATDSSITSSQTSTVSSTVYIEGEIPYVFNDPISKPYAYASLEGDKKLAYDIIVAALKNHEKTVTFPSEIKITSADYCDIYQQIYNTEHTIFYIDTQMKYTTNVKTNTIVSADLCYIYTGDEVASMQKKIDERASAVISKITDDMSEYKIVKMFFDELASSCVYDVEASNCRDIYGCLVTQRAVCGGYAKAFSYLCDKVGIQSLTITGDFDTVPHMWNMVNIGGEWYHVDVTAGVVTNSVTTYIRYDYFCVTDEVSAKTHKVYDQSYSYPAASSNKYNYYVYNNLVADSVEKAFELIRNGIISAASKGECVIQFSCSDDDVFDKIVFELFDKSRATALTIYEDAYADAAQKYNRESIIFNQEKSTRVIKLFLEYL
ncbi:MAG: hypothetical protein IJF18_06710 [Oscillospiraceae bacterium]|nr:hypothetical protein [Oscillospiraceae bacterium]